MTWYLGIDIGSATSKGVLFNKDRPVAHFATASGIHYGQAALKVRDAILAQAQVSAADVACTVSTGHGADIVTFSDRHVSDAQCCARGVHYLLPAARTVIDVQGQTCQVILLDHRGRVQDLALSEKCASGSGGFVEIIANVLQVPLKDVGPLSLNAKNPVNFSSGCAVFGESEAISRVAEGTAKEDILAGVHNMLAGKLSAMAHRLGVRPPCAVTGGGGLNSGLIRGLETVLGEVAVAPYPEMVNALGAADIARQDVMETQTKKLAI